MSKKIGTLSVDFIAETGGFTRGIDKADRELKGFSHNARRYLDKVEGYAQTAAKSIAVIGTAGLAAGTRLVALVNHQADATKEANNMARALGINTGQLQAFGLATSKVGVNMDQAGQILKDYLDKLGDAVRTGWPSMPDLTIQPAMTATVAVLHGYQGMAPGALLFDNGEAGGFYVVGSLMWQTSDKSTPARSAGDGIRVWGSHVGPGDAIAPDDQSMPTLVQNI